MAKNWLDDLNSAQREAVTFGTGPLLVIAGAGTGKTKTLACRVAYLIEQGVKPERILLLTFTRRAAAEMIGRAQKMCNAAEVGKVWNGTFHAVANRLLRIYGRYSPAHKLALIGLLAVLAGRFLEQMVGLARVSDLTIFWALLGVFVALPGVMQEREPAVEPPSAPGQTGGRRRRGSASRSSRDYRPMDWQLFWRLAVVAWLFGGIVALTWVKTLNYPRAAVAAGQAVEDFQRGDYQAAVVGLDRAIEMAPDVSIYYTHQATVYGAYLRNRGVAPERECSLELNGVPYETCLVLKAYLTNQAGAEQRPFYWRSRLALAGTAWNLGRKDEAIRLHQEVVSLVPNSWPLLNRLAEVYLDLDQPAEALEVLEASLAINNSGDAVRLQELANQQLEQLNSSASLP